MKTPEELKAYKRQWQLNNRDKFRAYNKKYYIKNREKVLAGTSKWKKENREKVCLYAKRSAAKNPERIKAYRFAKREHLLNKQRERRSKKKSLLIELGLKTPWVRPQKQTIPWKVRNKERMRAYFSNYSKTNIQRILKRRQSARIQKALKGIGLKKRFATLKYVGINTTGLKQYLESLFKPGMTWANRSLWHIDHKLPCSSFDLTIEAEQMKCFHYTNLQPLWWWENLSKSDKIAA